MATITEDSLRSQLRGVPGVSPEDTKSELLEAQKEERKAQEFEAMRAQRESTARAWTVDQAKAQAARDVADHAEFSVGVRSVDEARSLRGDMWMQSSVNPAYAAALKNADASLHSRVMNFPEEVRASSVNVASKLQESVSPTAKLNDDQAQAVKNGLQQQLDEELARRKAREQEEAGKGLNTVNVQKTGKELERGEFITPRRITQSYTEVDGKFFAKESNRVMFEDKGEKLATSTTDKAAIADMVIYAKAKQWDSLKLTGSQEFRREAWLQAESQGMRTQGYTPKEKDLAEMEKLRQERSTNSIQPLQDRTRTAPEVAAPRHDINKNQAVLATTMKTESREHLEAIKKIPGLEGQSFEHLNKLAELRALVAERDKLRPPGELAETLARFDKMATDPQFVKRIGQETLAKVEDKTTERVKQRSTQEHTL